MFPIAVLVSPTDADGTRVHERTVRAVRAQSLAVAMLFIYGAKAHQHKCCSCHPIKKKRDCMEEIGITAYPLLRIG